MKRALLPARLLQHTSPAFLKIIILQAALAA